MATPEWMEQFKEVTKKTYKQQAMYVRARYARCAEHLHRSLAKGRPAALSGLGVSLVRGATRRERRRFACTKTAELESLESAGFSIACVRTLALRHVRLSSPCRHCPARRRDAQLGPMLSKMGGQPSVHSPACCTLPPCGVVDDLVGCHACGVMHMGLMRHTNLPVKRQQCRASHAQCELTKFKIDDESSVQ